MNPRSLSEKSIFCGPNMLAFMSLLLLGCGGRVILAGDAGTDAPQPPQAWSITIGGERDEWLRTVIEAPDGGYAAAGWTTSSGEGERDCFVVRLSARGDILWQRSYGGPGRDEPRQIIPASGGGFIVAGFTTSWGGGASDGWVFKIDADGNLLWQKALGSSGNDTIEAALEATDGGTLLAGGADPSGTGSEALWILMLAMDGSVQWQKTYQLDLSNQAYALEQTSDGGFVVAAQIAHSGLENSDAWVMKIDPSGDIAWQNSFGSDGKDLAASIARASDGGYIVAGWSDSFGDGTQDAWVIKLDGGGEVTWQNVYDGGAMDWAEAVVRCADGGAIVAGGTGEPESGPWSVWIFKLDARGSMVWQKIYNGAAGGYALDLRPTSDGGSVAAAWALSLYSWYDAWLIKTTEDGDISDDCPPGFAEEFFARARPSTAAAHASTVTPLAGTMQVLDVAAAAAATSLVAKEDCRL
jgi:hypothetical protein